MEILKKLYSDVKPLGQYILEADYQKVAKSRLIKDEDEESYISLLEKTFVATWKREKNVKPLVSEQKSYLPLKDLIISVIQKLQHQKSEKNLLTIGYSHDTDSLQEQLAGGEGNTNVIYKNSAVLGLLSKEWATLHERIGDDLMVHLLESRSLFSCLPENCWLQLTGVPVFELWPFTAGSAIHVWDRKQSRKNDPVTNRKSLKRKVMTTSAEGHEAKRSKVSSSTASTVVEVTSDVWDKYVKVNVMPVEQEKKKKRRRKKKKSKVVIECPGKPYRCTMLVPRVNILYCKNLREQLSSTACLWKAQPKNAGDICTNILGRNVGSKLHHLCQAQHAEEEQSAETLKLIICDLLKKHSNSRYKHLINHHCPANFTTAKRNAGKPRHKYPNLSAKVFRREGKTYSIKEVYGKKIKGKAEREKGKIRMSELLARYNSHREVYLFLRHIILKVIPLELLGSSHNRNVFLKNVSKFVSLGRFEKMSLCQIMERMKVNDCCWLRNLPCHQRKQEWMAKVLFWLMEEFIMQFLRAYFYITDTAVYRNRIFYFRKSIWKRIKQKATAEYLKQEILKRMPENVANGWLTAGRCLGLGTLRFLPKAKSLRPIINMNRKGKPLAARQKTVNWMLQNVLHVLTWMKNENQRAVGSAKFGLDEIYETWKRYKDKRHENNDKRPLFFCKVDVKDCYDSIDQIKLYGIVSGLLKQVGSKEFIVRRYAAITVNQGVLQRNFVRKAVPKSKFQPDFKQILVKDINRGKYRNAVFVDQVVHQHETIETVLKKLKSYLYHNIVKIGQGYYHQAKGIAQGCILSTLLCNLYYGSMEAKHLPVQEDELMMRQVDDFLFITPHHHRAVQFMEKMAKGIPEYNCFSNQEKAMSNLNGSKSFSSQEWFPWCGLLFNTQTLATRSDYTRYWGLSVSDTFTVDLHLQPGVSLMNKLMSCMRMKCHGILFDASINSKKVAIENAFKLHLLAAYRFHCAARRLNPKQRVHHNPRFFFRKILSVASFSRKKIVDSVRRVTQQAPSSKFPVSVDMTKNEMEWICVKAFLHKLMKHQGGYKPLVRMLENHLRNLSKRKDLSSDELQKIVNSAFLADFSGILD